MLSKSLVAAAFAALNTEVAFGSLPASTDFDFVDVYADTSSLVNQSGVRIQFYLKGTTSGQTTTLKTYGPFAPKAGGVRIGQLEAQPGVTYTLTAAIVSGPVPAETISAGLVGFDASVNAPIDVQAGSTALVYNTEVTLVDYAEFHTQWNFRVGLLAAPFPSTTFRFYAIVQSGGVTIEALIKETTYNNPTTSERFQVFSLENVGTDRVRVTAVAKNSAAAGASATTASWVLIGSDPNLDGAAPSPSALAQTDWYIDPVNGSDDWTGTAAAHVAGTTTGPIKTIAEYVRRTGLYRPISVFVTIHILNDVPAGDSFLLTGVVTNAASGLLVVGENLTQLVTGTLDAYTAPVPAANTVSSLTDAAVADWTPYLGKLMRLTSGPRAAQGGSTWIVTSIGVGQARCGVPNYRTNAFNLASFVPAGNETYEVVDLRVIASPFIVDINAPSTTGQFFEARYLSFTATVPLTLFGGAMWNCKTGILVTANACQFTFLGHQFSVFCNLNGFIGVQGCYFNGATTNVLGHVTTQNSCPSTSRAGTMNVGAGITVGDAMAASLAIEIAGSLQIEGTTNYFNVRAGSLLAVNGDVYGDASVGTLYTVRNGGFISYTATALRVGGATNDFTLATKTQVFPYDAATGLPQAVVQTCSIANLLNAALFNGNIHDPFTGTRVLVNN